MLRRMPRRPRLPILAAYLCLFTLVFLLYVSARGPQQEVSAASGQGEETQPRAEDATTKTATATDTKTKGRNKKQPINPHDFHMIINNPKICNGDNAVSNNSSWRVRENIPKMKFNFMLAHTHTHLHTHLHLQTDTHTHVYL